MKILNLYAGLGGNRTLWNHEIIAVEYDPKIAEIYHKRFPEDQVLIEDVFTYLQSDKSPLNNFDFIWASPPCQSHSHMQIFTKKDRKPRIPRFDETIGLAVWLNKVFSKPFVIENVIPWCGIIDLKRQNLHTAVVDRHLFISNFSIPPRGVSKRGNNKHGQIGGIMRKSREELMTEYQLPEWILDDLIGVHDKDQIIRNCVEPKIGQYILQCVQNQDRLLSFF